MQIARGMNQSLRLSVEPDRLKKSRISKGPDVEGDYLESRTSGFDFN
jgi:hypothetical protein